MLTPLPENSFDYRHVLSKLVVGGDVSYMDGDYAIEGIPGIRRLGDGYFYNTHGVVTQFAAALALAEQQGNADIPEILSSRGTPQERTQRLLKAKVLANMRILDLCCGRLPTLALAVGAFGATAYTADVVSFDMEDMSVSSQLMGQQQARHTTTDLVDIDTAIPQLITNTGGGLDLVIQGVIERVYPGQMSPSLEHSLAIADALLRNGGHFLNVVHGPGNAPREYQKTS